MRVYLSLSLGSSICTEGCSGTTAHERKNERTQTQRQHRIIKLKSKSSKGKKNKWKIRIDAKKKKKTTILKSVRVSIVNT